MPDKYLMATLKKQGMRRELAALKYAATQSDAALQTARYNAELKIQEKRYEDHRPNKTDHPCL